MQHPSYPLNTLVPLLIVFVVIVLRMRRMAAMRPMRLKSLWIRPAILTLLAAVLVYSAPRGLPVAPAGRCAQHRTLHGPRCPHGGDGKH